MMFHFNSTQSFALFHIAGYKSDLFFCGQLAAPLQEINVRMLLKNLIWIHDSYN